MWFDAFGEVARITYQIAERRNEQADGSMP